MTYFVQISDTHLGPTKDYELYGQNTYRFTQQLVDKLRTLPVKLDFIVHTGDLVNMPDDEAGYGLAAVLFGELDVPLYFVNGNHDRARNLHRFMPLGDRQSLDEDELFYTFSVGDERFVVLDSQVEDDALAPRGRLSAKQLAWLRDTFADSEQKVTVFVHHPTTMQNVPWMDKDGYMQIINGDEVHEAFAGIGRNLRGVFHGHLHRPFQLQRDNVTYYGAPSTFANFVSFPTTIEPTLDTATVPAFNFVQLLNEQTIVQLVGI